MDSKEAFEKKAKAQLDEWQAEIDRLKAKMEKADADARIEYNKQMDELKAKYDSAYEKFKKVRDSSGEAWQDIRSGLEKAWKDMGDSVSLAISKFK